MQATGRSSMEEESDGRGSRETSVTVVSKPEKTLDQECGAPRGSPGRGREGKKKFTSRAPAVWRSMAWAPPVLCCTYLGSFLPSPGGFKMG